MFHKNVVKLLATLVPFLVWQIISDGRSGLLLSILTITVFFTYRYSLRLGVLSFFGTIAAIYLLSIAVNIASSFIFQVGQYLEPVEAVGRLSQFHGGFFRSIFTLNFDNVFGFINHFSSGRLYALVEIIEKISAKRLILGYGVGNFLILENQHYPHIELLRHLVELGAAGFLIASLIYFLPIRHWGNDSFNKFSISYLFVFLLTTLLQPSGPLIHLNSAFLFWVVYSDLEKNQSS